MLFFGGSFKEVLQLLLVLSLGFEILLDVTSMLEEGQKETKSGLERGDALLLLLERDLLEQSKIGASSSQSILERIGSEMHLRPGIVQAVANQRKGHHLKSKLRLSERSEGKELVVLGSNSGFLSEASESSEGGSLDEAVSVTEAVPEESQKRSSSERKEGFGLLGTIGVEEDGLGSGGDVKLANLSNFDQSGDGLRSEKVIVVDEHEVLSASLLSGDVARGTQIEVLLVANHPDLRG